jgi:hypothetical protein
MTVSKKELTAIVGVALITLMASSSTAYAIKNGGPDEDAHPYVCWIATWDGTSELVYLGTGSLIAPDVVLTAGHITQPPGGIAYAWVSFDPEFNPLIDWRPMDSTSGVWHEVAEWHHHPWYCIGCGKKGLTDWITYDVGVLILTDPVGIECAELPDVGLVDTLSMKEDVDLVGYGVQYQIHGGGPPDWDWIDFGYRYFAQAKLIASNHILSDEFLRLTANPGNGKGGTCYGDSGSPILLAGTNTILGVCSWGPNGNCAGVSYEQRIDLSDILEWIQSWLS